MFLCQKKIIYLKLRIYESDDKNFYYLSLLSKSYFYENHYIDKNTQGQYYRLEKILFVKHQNKYIQLKIQLKGLISKDEEYVFDAIEQKIGYLNQRINKIIS